MSSLNLIAGALAVAGWLAILVGTGLLLAGRESVLIGVFI